MHRFGHSISGQLPDHEIMDLKLCVASSNQLVALSGHLGCTGPAADSLYRLAHTEGSEPEPGRSDQVGIRMSLNNIL